jgi:integrase
MTNRVYEWLLCWQQNATDENTYIFNVKVTIKTAWDKICHEAELEDFHFHDCRAAAISRMIAAGMPPAEVMRVSGHTTLRAFYIYVRTDIDSAYRAASLLDALNIESSVQEANTIVH